MCEMYEMNPILITKHVKSTIDDCPLLLAKIAVDFAVETERNRWLRGETRPDKIDQHLAVMSKAIQAVWFCFEVFGLSMEGTEEALGFALMFVSGALPAFMSYRTVRQLPLEAGTALVDAFNR